ncbi:MAG: lysophospholipid acyltransferase family protein [Gammaproteobacteria bacterium]|nr:lysophospholipid acyltransferase family protein [Gammaproteobacteria bacterium]
MGRPDRNHWPIHCALWLLRALIRLPGSWQTKIGRMMGRLAQSLLGRRRRIVRRNLELCFPELSAADRQHLLEAHFQAAGLSILEMANAWNRSLDDLQGHLEVLGSQHLEAARQHPGGVLFLGGHYLCMEIAGALFARHHPVDVVYKRQRHPVLDAAERRGRSRHFQTLIEHQQVRLLVRRLREGHSVWFAADQDQGLRGALFAPFFGVPAATLTSPLRLARLTGAKVLLLDMWRSNEGRRWTVRFRPLPEGFPSGDLSADASCLNASIEAAVREHPEQYLWLHRRFKTRPRGAPGVY